jgi:glycosyltransferase involved in cell wall biosynthesis
MRILMLNNEFPPLGGGMGTANQEVLRCLAERGGVAVDLVTASLGTRYESARVAPEIQIFNVPVRNQNLHHSTGRELLTYAALALPVALTLHRHRPYDLCLAWSTLPAGAVALALRQRVGLPYLVWVSGPDIPGFERRYRAIYPMLTPVIRQVWQAAERVIAKCAEEIAMIQRVAPGLDVECVPNGVALDRFQPGPAAAAEGPLRVVCVARLIERKGQHHLIEAVARLVRGGIPVRLRLVGTGDAEAQYRALAERLGVSAWVEFAGYVPREAIAGEYAAAHVFALPSYNEGMALAVLEAMACGLPVVVTRTGGTAELVEEEVGGLTHDWADIDALAAHLARLARDRELVQRMGVASLQRAASFSWPAITDRFLELFEHVTTTAMSTGG